MAANHPRCTDMSAPNYWPHPLVPLHQDSFPYGPDSAHQPPQMPTFANPRGASTTTALVGATGAQGPTLVQPPTAPSSGPEVSRTRDDHGRTENVGGGSGHDSRHSFASAPSVDDSPVPVPQKPIRRRMRMITSCLECRRRKLKCEKKQPCYNCKRFQRNCVYLSPNLDEASQQRLTEIKEKVGSLERQLERDVAKGARARRSSSPDGDSSRSRRFVADDVVDEDGEPQITPLVALDLTYDDYSDGNGTDDLIDLGIRVGKMRITERIGGLNRPRLSEEIQAGLEDAPPHLYASSVGLSPASLQDTSDRPDFLKPGETYLAPTSGLFFGQFGQHLSFLSLLPHADLCYDPNNDLDCHDLGCYNLRHDLMRRYFDAVHPIARCVHRPSFDVMYTSFWDDVRQNIEPRPSIQAIIFAAWFSAAVTVDEAFCREHHCSKSQLVNNMKIATEAALSKANFLSTTRFETLQGFVMYLLPLCRDEVSRAHSVLVGAAVRMAECMGLHRDGSAYGLSPLETQVRRLVWHQLCFLDIRTCEAQGPKPAIRREDYDTQMPLNCEEDVLTPHTTAWPPAANSWTSTLLSIIRFEINEMMRNIWTDRRKLELRKTTFTAMLTKVENFRKRMLERYDRMLDDRIPIQRYARLVMQLLIFRLHVMVLHPYHSNTVNPLPDKLNGLLVTSGVFIIQIAIRLESDGLFKAWAWYIGAYQQYQVALLLATEIYYRPAHREAERIWPCLDWVFQLDPNTPREQKIWQILTEIANKTKLYILLRKVRAPTSISQAVPERQAVKESPPAPPPETVPRPGQAQRPQQQQPPSTHPPGSGTMSSLKTEHDVYPPPISSAISPGAQTPHPPLNVFISSSLTQSPLGMGTGMNMLMPPPPPGTPQQHMLQQSPLGFIHPPMPPPLQHHHQMVFSGVTNGEALWSLPPRHNVPGSPENSSDGGSVVGQAQRHGSITSTTPRHTTGPAGAGVAMPGGQQQQQQPGMALIGDLEWETLHALFRTDPQTGQLCFDSFAAADFVMPPGPPPGAGAGGGGGGGGGGCGGRGGGAWHGSGSS